MRIYSAGEAIGPAWEHTKALLWQDRSPKRLLKICLVALFAELGGANLNGSFPGRNTDMPREVAAFFAIVTVIGLLIGLVIALVMLYLGSRLQFVLFDMLVLRDPMVAPAWRRHGRHTWRWIGVKLTATLAIGLALSPLLIPAIAAFVRLVRGFAMTNKPGQMPHFSHPPLLTLVLLLLETFAAILLFVMLSRFFTSLALPAVALEDLSYTATFRRAWQIFRSDTPAMLLYALVQPLLILLLGLAGVLGLLVATVVMLLPLSLVGGLIYALAHKAALFGNILLGIYIAVALLVLLVAVTLCYLAVVGSLYTFARAWSLYFIGGRYPMLGEYLEPSGVAAPWTPPPPMPIDSDDSSGPDLPMNPALA